MKRLVDLTSFSLTSLFLILVISCNSDNGDTVTTPPVPMEKDPNILLIIADDMGLDASPGYSNGTIKPNMPHLQDLQSSGITFDNAWANPTCSPTRATILTGKYGVRTGVLDPTTSHEINANEKSIQAYLNDNLPNTYATSIIGKWHLSNNQPTRPTDMGADYYAGLLGGGVADYSSWSLTENAQTNTSNEYITTKITDMAIDWIGNQTKPWFAWVAYTAPHTPFHLPPSNMHGQGSLPTDQASIDANPLPYYLAMIESLDFNMGRLFDSMTTEELDNTVIIFIGDNGSPNPVTQSPYTVGRAKGSVHQGGIQVPLVISGKDVSRIGQRESSLVASVDLFATISEIAGITNPDYEDSKSFYGLLSNSGSGSREYNYAENEDDYAIRNDRYKLIRLANGNSRLYDLQTDPYETDNLMIGGSLNTSEQAAFLELDAEADAIRE